MKEGWGSENLAIAWEYSGKMLEVIPARFSFTMYDCAIDVGCGATLDTWTGISGGNILDLIWFTNYFIREPNYSMRLFDLLEVPSGDGGENYGSRMKGWLRPPVTGIFNFYIAADDNGEFWLSTDSDAAHKVRACYTPGSVGKKIFTTYSEQKSKPIPLVAGSAYYYEVRENETFHSIKHLQLWFRSN
jgi:hypothetical protein